MLRSPAVSYFGTIHLIFIRAKAKSKKSGTALPMSSLLPLDEDEFRATSWRVGTTVRWSMEIKMEIETE